MNRPAFWFHIIFVVPVFLLLDYLNGLQGSPTMQGAHLATGYAIGLWGAIRYARLANPGGPAIGAAP